MGKVGKPEDATILARVMTVDTLEDCRIAAIDALGRPEGERPEDRRHARRRDAERRPGDPPGVVARLRKITGKDYGLDALAWQKALADGGESKSALASASTTVPKAATPSYPPKPVAPPVIVAADADPEARPARRYGPGPAPKHVPPDVGIGSYPKQNPNIPSR